MPDLSTATWIMGLLTIGCGVVATVMVVFSGEIWDWALTLVVLFGVGLLFLVAGRVFAIGINDSKAY